MSNPPRFSDEDLTAFLDGEADADLSARIEAGRDAALQARLDRLEIGRAEAVAHWAGVADLASAFPVPIKSGRRSAAKPALAGLAAGVALAVAVGWGFGGANAQFEPWHTEVAAYHALYVPQTLKAAQVSVAEGQAQLERLSTRVGRDLTVLPQAEGLEFRRAQELGFDGAVLVQMAFLAEGDVPMALCVLEMTGQPEQPTSGRIRGLAAVSWADANHRFILIGGTDDAQVAAWAAQFRTSL